jgi:hypothetical protein
MDNHWRRSLRAHKISSTCIYKGERNDAVFSMAVWRTRTICTLLKNMLIVNISLNQLEAVQPLRLERRCRGLARPSAVTIVVATHKP